MDTSGLIRGLYAITRDTPDLNKLILQVRQAIAGGASIVQYRNKRSSNDLARMQAQALRAVTHASGTLFIVNDDIDLAFSVGADGVHIGRDDGDAGTIARIREQCPLRAPSTSFTIGVSCYNELKRAETAVAAGADYIAFGSFFSSPTKPHAIKADLALIGAAKAEFDVPIVAIGGITIDNAQQLISAKVDALAVISALFDAEDIAQRAREFNNLFKCGNHVYLPQQ